MTDLGDYLRSLGGRKREPGVFDCVTLPAEWAMANGYLDPMAHWRGAYDSEEAAQDFIRDAGGLVVLFDCGAAAVGIERREGEPQPGDVGVIRIGEHEAGAIFTGKRWAFVADRGIAFASIDPDFIVAVWGVGRG